MADLEEGEIPDSSADEMQSEEQNQTEKALTGQVKWKGSPDYSSFTGLREASSRVSAIKSTESSGYRSNTPDVGSDSGAGSDSEEDTPLWRQKKAKYFRSQKEQAMAVCPSPTLPEYKPQSPQTNQQEPPTKKRKNNVWGSVLMEQDLTQSMVRSGQMLEKTDFNYVERYVESYDFSQKYREQRPDIEESISHKSVQSNDPFDKVLESYEHKASRSIVDYEEGLESSKPRMRGIKRKAEVRDRLGSRKGDIRDRLGSKVKGRLGAEKVEGSKLGELNVSIDMEEAELAQKIAEYLHEPKVEIIERVISCLGKEEAIDITNKTRDVEDSGGLMTKDGERRRTPGGVYIQLMRASSKYSTEVHKVIFKEDIEAKIRQRQEQRKQRKERKRQQREMEKRNYELKKQEITDKQQHPSNTKTGKSKTFETNSNPKSKERRSWSTESEASSSENEIDSHPRDLKSRMNSGNTDFQAELENTKNLILRSKSKENTDCVMEEEQSEGLKEAKSVESLPEEEKENMEDSGMNDLLEEESNVIDIPLGDE